MCFNIYFPSSSHVKAPWSVFVEYAGTDTSKQADVDEMVENGKKIEDNVEHKADEMNEAVEKEVGFLEVIVFLNSCVGINSSFL